MTAIKFCGITTPQALSAASQYGADYIGLMLWDKSPRALHIDQARALTLSCPDNLRAVGVFVNPSDDHIKRILAEAPLDMIQLHGDEDAARVAHIRSLTGLPVIKAIRIATREDLFAVPAFESVADWLLFDTKIDPKISHLPGGTGHSFDWQILKDRNFRKPWMLSGGLKLENIQRALSILEPFAVDISSGIEDAPGVKNPDKMKALTAAIKGHTHPMDFS
ncbi:MAG TPA: phosphoribosylanthranilate isomerase [Micavibrio sp.]